MDVIAAIKCSMDTSDFILTSYLEDFSDEDCLVRPVENAHHTAWHLGHLISSMYMQSNQLKPDSAPALPSGFIAQHSKEKAASNSADDFRSKEEYLKLYQEQSESLKKILGTMSESDLDAPGPEEMQAYAPTVGAVLSLQGTHVMMHAGQISVIRRKLDKPIVI